MNQDTMDPHGANVERRPGAAARPRTRLVKSLWLGGVVAALALSFFVGSVVTHSQASPGFLGGFGGHGCRRHAALSTPEGLEKAREHVRYAAGWVLRSVDATDEQKEKVGGIAAAVVTDLAAIAPEHRTHREALLEILSAPEVDRDRLEEIRAAEVRLIGTASSRVVQGLADIAEVLTPEQRADLIKSLERFHH